MNSKDFFTKNFKIVFVMQSLIDEFKKSGYRFEKNKFDHDYTFEKFSEYFFNFVEDSMNCQLHQTQLYANAKQSENQTMQNFDVHLNTLKIHLFLYTEQQRMMHLIIKFRSILRIVLIDYQDLPNIKKNLLSLIVKLKNNMRIKNEIETQNFRNDKNNHKFEKK